MKKFLIFFVLTLTCTLDAQVGMDQYMQLSFPMTQTYEKALEICKERGFTHFLIRKVSYKDEQGQTLMFNGISHAEGGIVVSETITRKFDSPIGTLHVEFELLCFKKAPNESLAINVQDVFDLISVMNNQQLPREIKKSQVREVKNIEDLKMEITKVKGPIYLDCYSSNCPPCKIFDPIFDQISKDFSYYGTFLKVNLENVPEMSDQYKIKSIPTLIVFEGQKEVTRKSSLAEILEYFQTFIPIPVQESGTGVISVPK